MFLAIINAVRASRTLQLVLLFVALALLGVGLYAWSLSEHNDTVKRAAESGRAEQQRDNLEATVNQTEKANAAAVEVRTDPVARRDGCVRHSRTPENC